MLVLQVLQGPDRGRTYEVPTHEPQLIGRSSEALPITDHTVSRRHAELTPDDGTWFLRDLESANGTYLNGHRIMERMELSPGDQIRVGSTVLLYTSPADDRKTHLVEVLAPDALDVTVERSVDANEDSMIMAAPDPIRAAMDHLRVIYDLTAMTTSAFSRDELLNKVMDLVFDEFQPDRGFILLQDQPGARPEAAVVRYKEKPKSLDEGRIPVSQTIISHTLEKAEGILSTNAMSDKRFRSGDSVRDYGIRSAICVPIQTGHVVMGVIHIDSSMINFTFNESQLRLMNAIGQHTGLAMVSVGRLQSKMQTERLAAVGEAVASLSHSTKNILQGLRGGADAVELALKRGNVELAMEGWPILARNLDRIYALTLNMLTYSRPPQLELELTSMAPLITEVVELLQPSLDRKRLALMTELDDAMPPIPVDPNAMHQAIMNLVTNAIEAVSARKGVITISSRYVPKRHEALISISDNGIGIDQVRQAEVFKAFTSYKGQRGTGLGLAVTHKILREHGGRLELRSKPAEGATFTMVLPSERATMDPADTELPRPRARRPQDLEDSF